MEQQTTIEDYRALMSRRDHPSTSREAAASVNVGALQAKVLRAFEEAGKYGFTDEELDKLHAGASPTLRPRRVELARKGVVVDSGTKGETSTGRKAIVWVHRDHKEQADASAA